MISVINYASGKSLPAVIIANPGQSLTSFASINTKDKSPSWIKKLQKKGRQLVKATVF